jgi:hypothetical protein
LPFERLGKKKDGNGEKAVVSKGKEKKRKEKGSDARFITTNNAHKSTARKTKNQNPRPTTDNYRGVQPT